MIGRGWRKIIERERVAGGGRRGVIYGWTRGTIRRRWTIENFGVGGDIRRKGYFRAGIGNGVGRHARNFWRGGLGKTNRSRSSNTQEQRYAHCGGQYSLQMTETVVHRLVIGTVTRYITAPDAIVIELLASEVGQRDAMFGINWRRRA